MAYLTTANSSFLKPPALLVVVFVSFSVIRVECERAGAVLATIDNQTIHDRLVDVSPGTDTQSEGYWIGLSRVDWVSAAGIIT